MVSNSGHIWVGDRVEGSFPAPLKPGQIDLLIVRLTFEMSL